jgi:F-type H+-transporting ATPase subunit b
MELNPTTLIFEIVNFVVLVWLLSRLLYRPLREAITKRERELAVERAQSQAALTEAAALKTQWEEKNRGLVTLADQVRSEALADAMSEQARMLARAHEEAAAERGKAKTLLHAEREAAEQWVRNMAVERSTDLAGRMLLALAPDAVDAALTDRLIDELAARGRDLLGDQHADDLEVEVVATHAPREPVLERLRGALATALSAPPRLAVREDPSLGAGLSLRVGDRVLDASLKGQLQAFRLLARDLSEDQAHG